MDHLEKIIADVRKTLQSGYYRVRSQESQWVRPSLCEAIERRRGRAVIAELKPASPVSGPLIRDRSPAEILTLYTRSEIVGLSVLTEPVHFGGSLELLAQASATGLPTLMKDFIVAPEQIAAGAWCGASAVLLIVTLFQRRWTSLTLKEAITLAHEHGLEVLTEVASVEEFLLVQGTDADMIGINNRDLTTLKVDTARTVEILKKVRKDRPVWSLSGIETAQDLQRLSAAGADAFLIGTALMQAADPARKLREVLAHGDSEDLRHSL